TPDGTGSARIGDFVQVYATYPGSGQFAYRAKPDCFTGSSILPPTDITNLFFKTTTSMGNNNITVRFSKWCAGEKVISPIYIVHIDDSGNPAPFLDLPWKYQEKGLSFDIAATAMTSYFDHEYPFLSTSLVEPPEASGNIIDFRGPPRSGRSYSLHDGYDWGRVAQAKNNEPVVAAATGSAQYVNTCGACGNAIHIDHGNGFQTRYYHLQKGGLITDVPGVSVPVEQGHQIGKVGFTGNVFPAGENGAHIHFMLVYDKNADGNFEDNIPDGLIDPFGWQSKDPDPWENYTFSYGGVDRTGMKSHYLWTTPLAGVTTAVPSNGKNTPVGSYEVITTASTNNNTEFELKAFLTPIIPPSIDLGVLGPGIVIDAFDILGNVITTFAGTYTLTVDFAEIDLSRYDPDTISLYSSSDGDNWIKEELTSIDLANKTATAELNHLTHFALMANRIDTTAPVTNVIFDGLMLSEDVFGNYVTVSLEASDGAGLGVDYIAYRFEGEDWQAYTEPISVASEGAHTIDFYAADKDENIEEVKSKVFTIEKDTTPPETSVNLIGELVGIDVYRSDVTIDFTASDGAGFGVDRTLYSMDGGEWQEVSSSILVSTDGEHTLKYYSVDRGGNAEEQQSTQFTIQHVYDTIPPEITIKFDTASKKFVYTATDSSGSASLVVNSLSQKTDEVIATDESDNELIVTLEKLRNPILSLNIVATNIETLQYGDEAVIRPGRNNLGVLYSTDRQGELKLLTQVLTSESFGNVVLHYDFGKDTTTIVETINKKIVTKKIGGMKLLQLSTNAGRLEYRY
ncbi:MAG: M23 family metallopeptidase, partial [Candidatus Levybacteria bacterium]|nr:M23 family metallopeptidase [Candidatus Levybacteria bacterium]